MVYKSGYVIHPALLLVPPYQSSCVYSLSASCLSCIVFRLLCAMRSCPCYVSTLTSICLSCRNSATTLSTFSLLISVTSRPYSPVLQHTPILLLSLSHYSPSRALAHALPSSMVCYFAPSATHLCPICCPPPHPPPRFYPCRFLCPSLC